MNGTMNKTAHVSNHCKKILLVSSKTCDEVEKALANAGCVVVIAKDGGTAISQARVGLFDAAVLVSTGREMELAATALNLRAVRISMPIVIATGFAEAGETYRRRGIVASLIPNTKLLDVERFGSFFQGLAEVEVEG
jgi:ActR/RegA family two-component response regulator